MASWFLGSTEAPSSMETTMDDLVKRLRERDIAAAIRALKSDPERG